ncbi:spermatogenesis-associated protein 31D1 [Phodopus roborovskii]|uniref:spermatogenesis-associated protein 31D1 n=1 Tax=Phodopus roborovskii TaxID=109678 RepID=UPI0021E4B51D|nr:spermatogenesis-associated protein 31D1 [Phodopus roborovskii]
MENILSSLNSLAETWLAFGPAPCHVDLNYSLLSGLGLLLLSTCYLLLKVVLPSLWKKECTQKLQEKAKEARESLKGAQTCEDITDQCILQRPLGELCDAPQDEGLPHPEPVFGMCHRTSGQASHVLPQATLKDGDDSHSCLASTAPATETCDTENQPGHPTPVTPPGPLPLDPSNLSPNHFAHLESWLSSLPPEAMSSLRARFQQDPIPPHTLTSFTPPTEGAREAEVVYPLETTRSPVSGPSEVSVNVPDTKGTGYISRPLPDPSRQQPAAHNLLSSDLAHSINQHLPDPHASQAALQEDLPEPGNLLPPNSDALVQLKRQDKKEGDFLTKDKEKKEYFIKSAYSSEKLSSAETLAKSQELAASHSASSKGKPTHQQAPHSKTSEDDAEAKPAQLFWGLPSLHSEALHPDTTTASHDHTTTFNSMAEAPTADDSPSVTLPTPLSVTKSQPQTRIETPSQSHSQRDPSAESQAQGQNTSPVSVLTMSPQSQIRICGVHFHRPQDEAKPLGPCETQHLEYNVLKKEQERVWGLPSVVQKSRDTFCPSPPKISLVNQSFKAHTPRPILLGDFPLTDELRKKLEHHLRKRLIQHRWGLPHRINESLSLMCPHSELVDFPESGRSHGLSWLTLFKLQGSKDSHSIVLSGSGKFNNGIWEKRAREETEVKAKTDSQGIGQKHRLQRDRKGSLQSDLKTDQEPQVASQSGQLSSLPKVSPCQKKIENELEQHLNRKMKEIHEGQIPSTVGRSWHSISELQPPPQTPHGQVRRLAPLAGEKDTLKTQQSLSLSPSKEKMLEEHIKTFGRRLTFGLPQRVEESLESYKTKVEPSHSLSQFRLPPDAAVSAVDSAQPSRFLQSNTSRNRMGTLNFMPIQETPLPVSRPVRQMRPASKNKLFVDKDLSTAQSGREPTQPWTPGVVDKGSRQQSGSDNRHSSELPMRPDGPTDERLASRTSTQGPQGERISRKDGSMAEGSTELLKREQLRGLHPQSTETLTATQDTCQPLQRMSVPHNPGTSVYKSQVSRGAVLRSESRLPRQAAGQPDVAPASGEMTSKRQGPSGGDMVSSQVLRVHLPTAGVSMEPRQGPWLPVHVSGKCQNKECPPAARRVSPLAAEAGKFGGGDAGLGTSQTRGKRHSVQARAPEETRGHTSSPALSRKGQPPQDQFSSPAKCFLQWMSPGRKHKGQERSLAKASSPSPSVKGTSLVKKRCEFYGNIEASKSVRDPGVILRKPLGHRHGTVTPCPQTPVPPPLLGSAETQQEVQQLAQVKAVQRYHSRCQSARSQVQRAESCSPGQGQSAPKRCGVAGRAEMMGISPSGASQGARVPPKSYL